VTYGWIVRIVRDSGIAEDLTVETFWRIYQARSRFDPQASFGAWAYRIATNLAIDHVRSRHPEQELSEQLAQADSPDSVLRRETREQIVRAFGRLPAKLQVAAMLALIEEKPVSRNCRCPWHVCGRHPNARISGGAHFAETTRPYGCEAMTEPEYKEIQKLLKEAFPPTSSR
jgi:hypothetical protein